jgi:ferredoxin-type protein NapF
MSDRRQFFSSIFGLNANKGDNAEALFAPLPWFIESKIGLCLDCKDKPCKRCCPENIVVLTADGTPRLDFSKRGCTFCGDCAEACQVKCFSKDEHKLITVNISLNILNCLAWNGTICRSCADVCDENAVKFLGLFHPEIDPSSCTSCGFCIGVCPSQVIKINKKGAEGL